MNVTASFFIVKRTMAARLYIALTLLLLICCQKSGASEFKDDPEPKVDQNQCPPDSILDKLIDYEDLMIGELHGTVETPAFFRCLVDHAMKNSSERIIISLEMQSSAREQTSKFWRKEEGEDGRSSIAMGHLVRYLVQLEAKLDIDLHFQHQIRYFESEQESRAFFDNYAKSIGEEIASLATKGKMIVLAGNYHTMKKTPGYAKTESDLPSDFEGRYVGENFTHILVDSANGGTAWACTPQCEINTIPMQKGAKRGSIEKDTLRGHDYIYYLDIDKFTASAPHE